MNGETWLAVRHVLQRHVGGAIFLVVHHRMAVRERTATHVLTGNPDRMALIQQRGVGQRFCKAPVEPHTARLHFATVFIDLGNLALNIDTVGNVAHLRG